MSEFQLSAAEFRAMYERVKQMSRWGPADRRQHCPARPYCLAGGSPVNPIAIF
jgi:hypothetical protein